MTAGEIVAVAPGLRRLIAPNPGMMTGPGTNTYLLGDEQVTVVDPGPAIDAHIDAVCVAAGERIRQILVTHTHTDHSPAAMRLAALTGATLSGRPAPAGRHQDSGFAPDRVLQDGDTLAVDGDELTALHTPGHASNHLCYLRASDGMLFTGDHIIDGSTVVIDPPDGDMAAYLDSLDRLRHEAVRTIAPGHGELIENPMAAIDWLIDHRLKREAIVVDALRHHPATSVEELVLHAYREIDARLYPVAERSLLAHLIKLEADGRAVSSGDRWRPVE